jgi:acetylornithine deacetylase/succinyl-diaminopimelate desuccinylase-like protein
MAKVSMRLVPDQDYKEIERIFIDHVRSLAPEGVTVEVEALHGGQPWFAEPEGRCSTRPSAPWPAPTARTR